MTPEHQRLQEDLRREKNWQRWGPYLSERQWGTVREDYSENGDAWGYFPHDHARSRAYRWGEDGLLGFTDRECRLCFSLALWNGKDAILKERLYGVTGPQGNHGEDVKEHYYYLDSTPTHSYSKALYKYPYDSYPYEKLVAESAKRTRLEPEYEIEDSGIFDGSRYFDVFVEYAKNDPNDIVIRITAHNRGPEEAPLHLLPTLWFRNSWIWGCEHEGCSLKPVLWLENGIVHTQHQHLEDFTFTAEKTSNGVTPQWLFTENETNTPLLYGAPGSTKYYKDAFHRRVVNGEMDAVSPQNRGTKTAAWYSIIIPAGGEISVNLRLRLRPNSNEKPMVPTSADTVFIQRKAEADAFYTHHLSTGATPEESAAMRQCYAGLLWSKQFYHYVVNDWLDGDANQPRPPESRLHLRNHNWRHLFNRDVISMPDKWEYPWYAAWDLAFHMIPMAEIDPAFAKQQLLVFLREWYMHPNGALPAYEWNLSDVNPPVHAWAAWRVYKISAVEGERDRDFLARTFQKLVMNFTWWINRKDDEGRNVFSGGFLGLDNVGVFDRSKPLPNGAKLQQADGTAWMGFYCGTMLSMAIELALERPAYEDMASKFFEHFIRICDAINGADKCGLWDEEDGFYYDQMLSEHARQPLKVRSVVGWLPLIAVELIDQKVLEKLPGFAKRARWFLRHRGDLSEKISYLEDNTQPHDYLLLAMPTRDRLRRTLSYVFDEEEFLSPFGLRSLSKWHEKNPYTFAFDGGESSVSYDPGESTSGLFGGNSNWRGPIWFPVNYLFIEALERYHRYYGDSFKIEYPTRSGNERTLGEIAKDISARLGSLFLRDDSGKRPFESADWPFADDPNFRDYVLFHEYFHGETGRGLGANHQTGWTALAVRCLADRIWQRTHQKK